MAAIYSKPDGTQVYDYNGVTYNAKTGQQYAPAVSTPPAVTTPVTTTPATITKTSTSAPGGAVHEQTVNGVAEYFDDNGNTVPAPTITSQSSQADQNAAIAANQAAAAKLGISIPGVGGAAPLPSQVSTTPATTSTITSGGGIPYNSTWSKYGIDQNTWSQMNATQQGVVAAALTSASNLYSANASNVTLQSALTAAATDPTLTAKYADALKLDTNDFQQSLQQIQTATSTAQQNMQTQFENDRRQLADASAASGQAYSGFRGRAQDQLAQSESGIVTSSRSQLQKNLQDLTTSFESKYGTGASQAATANFLDPNAASTVSISGLSTPGGGGNTTLSGALAGNITGSQPVAKQQDINTLAGQYVTAGQIPGVIPA